MGIHPPQYKRISKVVVTIKLVLVLIENGTICVI